MKFAGIEEKVLFDLQGDFHRDIRGAKIALQGSDYLVMDEQKAQAYFDLFSQKQTGKAGDITAGLPPYDYVRHPYIEWFGDYNGRVVIELNPSQIEIVGTPIPYIESDPVSREEQDQLLKRFLQDMANDLKKHKEE